MGVILPAVVHDPGDLHGAAVWSGHTVSCNISHTPASHLNKNIHGFLLLLTSDPCLYLSPPRPESAGCSCLCMVSFPWKRFPTVRPQSSTRHSAWYNDLMTAGGSIGTGQSCCSLVVLQTGEMWPTIVQGFWSGPFDWDLSETTLCRVDPVVSLPGHPKVTYLHHVVLCNQTVPRCQVPVR